MLTTVSSFTFGASLPEGSGNDFLNQQWQGNCNKLDGLICGHDIDHYCETETDWCIECGVYCDEDVGYYDDGMCHEKCPGTKL